MLAVWPAFPYNLQLAAFLPALLVPHFPPNVLTHTNLVLQLAFALLLARSIGNEAPKINRALTDAVHNTAPLGALRTTIEYATVIIGGLQRGRARLGG